MHKDSRISDRLAALRARMEQKQIDFYMIPTADFHSSEYVSDYFKVREFFSNFTGSNGTLLVWRDGAGLWTDGRYFLQAKRELADTGIALFRMQEEGVPTILEFLKENMPQKGTLGFDGRVLTAREGLRFEKALSGKEVSFFCEEDPAYDVWEDRPEFPCSPLYVISDELAGESVSQKLARVREKLREQEAEGFFLTKLDDIMWLFNIRGSDVECNPVAMSYAYVDETDAVLFVQREALAKEREEADEGVLHLDHCSPEHLAKCGIQVREYGEVTDFLRKLPRRKILTDTRYCSYALYKALSERAEAVEKNNPTELLKAVKNPVELENMRKIYLKDSAALTKFIYWLKQNIGKIDITEVSAAEKLEEFRREIPEFLGLSFPTIAGYKANAAMMHYEATPGECAVLKPEGMLLVDSGGQYLGGTTDVTRTIVLGPITDTERKHYTLVAMGMLELSGAHWLHGCSGRNLDILARKPLWDIGVDYKCGTGHGVGYLLNVHEGPQSIRYRFAEGIPEAVLEEGMTVTNEPGVYVEGSHGIRIENVMTARNDMRNEYGQFMHFETLTWVPIDPEGIDFDLLPPSGREKLVAYQSEVCEKLAPYLNAEERRWLENCKKFEKKEF